MLIYILFSLGKDTPNKRFQEIKPEINEVIKDNLKISSNTKSDATNASSNIEKGLKLEVKDGNLKIEVKTSSKDKETLHKKLEELYVKLDDFLKEKHITTDNGEYDVVDKGKNMIFTYENKVEGVDDMCEESGGEASAESSVETNIGGDIGTNSGAKASAKPLSGMPKL